MDQNQQPASRIPHLSSRLPIPRKSINNTVNKKKLLGSFEKSSTILHQQSSGKGSKSLRIPRSTGHDEALSPNLEATEIGTIQPQATDEETGDGGLLPTGHSDLSNIEPACSDTYSGANLVFMAKSTSHQPQTPRDKRKPRPSLSDRTVETLSQIPPSPSPSRRRSSMFNSGLNSPMGPPTRPASAMSISRSRPQSPTKRPPVPAIPKILGPNLNARSLPPRRSTTQPASPTKSMRPVKAEIYARNPATLPSTSSKGGGPRYASPQRREMKSPRLLASSQAVSQKPLQEMQHFTTNCLSIKPSFSKSDSVASFKDGVSTSSLSQRSSAQSLRPFSAKVDANPAAKSSSSANSSKALREAIVKAKLEASSKAIVKKPICQNSLGPSEDPTNGDLDLEDSSVLLRKRIKTALQSGSLDVGALGLKLLPLEVKQMYKLVQEMGITWFECVDLTKFVAAGNELQELDSDVFPDVSDTDLEDDEGMNANSLFRGLEILNCQNNLLKEVTPGVRRLQNLRVLNLSGNRLEMSSFEIVSQIGESLVELRMSNNDLNGVLHDGMKKLSNLEILDLHANKITQLHDSAHELTHLKIFDVSQNRLSSIPSLLLSNIPLVELSASNNQLTGTLFPSHTRSMSTLKRLDVSHNLLDAVTSTGTEIVLTSIQSLNLGGNRLKTLCDLSACTELLTMNLGQTFLTEMPAGLSSLPKLRNLDLSNNDIRKLDDAIGFMDALVSINILGNPLRERKYLAMCTEDLKRELQNRSSIGDE